MLVKDAACMDDAFFDVCCWLRTSFSHNRPVAMSKLEIMCMLDELLELWKHWSMGQVDRQSQSLMKRLRNWKSVTSAWTTVRACTKRKLGNPLFHIERICCIYENVHTIYTHTKYWTLRNTVNCSLGQLKFGLSIRTLYYITIHQQFKIVWLHFHLSCKTTYGCWK